MNQLSSLNHLLLLLPSLALNRTQFQKFQKEEEEGGPMDDSDEEIPTKEEIRETMITQERIFREQVDESKVTVHS